MRNTIRSIALVAATSIALTACTNTDAGDSEETPTEVVAETDVGDTGDTGDAAETVDAMAEGEAGDISEVDDAALGSGQWTCYADKACEGKVLNHKDPHNCKRSGGKSDYNSRTGVCQKRL